MQIRHVEYFVTLARERHFGRAATACDVSQPTLSAGIGALESALGMRLVERDRRFVGLTADGEAALPWAQQMMSDYEGLLHTGAAAGRSLGGCLRIGAIPAAMPSVGVLAPVLAARHPDVEMKVLSMTSRQIERGLLSHELQAGITYLENEPLSGVVGTTFYHEHYLFATPRDGPFAGRDALSWTELAAVPLALLTPDMQNRRILDAQLRRMGVEVGPRVTADSYPALLSMVSLGGLSSIIPHIHVGALIDPAIRILPFAEPSPPQAVGLVVLDRHPMSPLARAALSAARSADCQRRMQGLREIPPQGAQVASCLESIVGDRA